jgi:hypothetical protein
VSGNAGVIHYHLRRSSLSIGVRTAGLSNPISNNWILITRTDQSQT